MASRMVHVSFNFDAETASVSGITNTPISKKIKVTRDSNCDFSYIELPQDVLSNISDTPEDSKWVFSWKQYHKHQQFLYLEQYVPFPVSDSIFHPNSYNPWCTLASYTYIANPSRGTIQTNKIGRKINHCFKKKFQLSMEVIGQPSIANWTTA